MYTNRSYNVRDNWYKHIHIPVETGQNNQVSTLKKEQTITKSYFVTNLASSCETGQITYL